MAFPLLAAAALPVVGNIASAFMQKKVNDSNQTFAHDAQTYQSQREDNAVQRQMADLKAAGLNPMLASGLGGANSSAVSQASQTAPELDLSGAASTALESKRVKKELEMQEQQTNVLEGQSYQAWSQKKVNDQLQQKLDREVELLDIEKKAASAESRLRVKQAQTDEGLVGTDAVINRAAKITNSLPSLRTIIRGGNNSSASETQRLERAGAKGIRVK